MRWEETLAFFDKLVDQCPDFERKGKKMIYTSANGYMFALLNKAGEIGIRLPKEVGQQFKETYGTGDYKSHGAVMRGYVHIPESLYSSEKQLVDYLNQGFQYVMSLPPK